MAIYYIDFTGGQDGNDGLSPEQARAHYADLALCRAIAFSSAAVVL